MNQLETQTQIVSSDMIFPPDTIEASQDAMLCAMPCDDRQDPPFWFSQTGYLMVCLCDVAPGDHTFHNGWLRCNAHDAVKLASMAGKNVLLHVRNERGDIMPVRQ